MKRNSNLNKIKSQHNNYFKTKKMNNKKQSNHSNQTNLRKIFQDIHQGLKSDHLTPSLQKKLSPFKKIIQKTKTLQIITKFNSSLLKNKNDNIPSISNENHQKNDDQTDQQNQEFLELYNNDPIFKCRIQRLFSEQQRKLKKGTLKSTRSGGYDFDDCDGDGQSLRVTLKSHVSENDRVLLSKISSYKKILNRKNSNDTRPSSQENQ